MAIYDAIVILTIVLIIVSALSWKWFYIGGEATVQVGLWSKCITSPGQELCFTLPSNESDIIVAKVLFLIGAFMSCVTLLFTLLDKKTEYNGICATILIISSILTLSGLGLLYKHRLGLDESTVGWGAYVGTIWTVIVTLIGLVYAYKKWKSIKATGAVGTVVPEGTVDEKEDKEDKEDKEEETGIELVGGASDASDASVARPVVRPITPSRQVIGFLKGNSPSQMVIPQVEEEEEYLPMPIAATRAVTPGRAATGVTPGRAATGAVTPGRAATGATLGPKAATPGRTATGAAGGNTPIREIDIMPDGKIEDTIFD